MLYIKSIGLFKAIIKIVERFNLTKYSQIKIFKYNLILNFFTFKMLVKII